MQSEASPESTLPEERPRQQETPPNQRTVPRSHYQVTGVDEVQR